MDQIYQERLYCKHCGKRMIEDESFFCGCDTLINSGKLRIGRHEISGEARGVVHNILSNLSSLDSDKRKSLRDLVSRLNQSYDRCEVAPDHIERELLYAFQTDVSSKPSNEPEYYSDFVTRPFGLSASDLISEEKFKNIFAFEAKVRHTDNPESKYLDKVVSRYFKNQHDDIVDLQQKGTFLLPNGKNLSVNALPDGSWNFDRYTWVIEIKTISRFSNIEKFSKLPEWLSQVACSQLPSLGSEAERELDYRRYLLVVILMETSEMFVLEVLNENLEVCKEVWITWLDNYMKKQNSNKDVLDLIKYNNGEIKFFEIRSIAKENNFRKKNADSKKEGWEPVVSKKKKFQSK